MRALTLIIRALELLAFPVLIYTAVKLFIITYKESKEI